MSIFTMDFFKSWLFILALNIISIITIAVACIYKNKYETQDGNNNKISPFALGVIVFLACLVCVGLLFFDVDGYIANLVSGNWSFGTDFVLPVFLLGLLVLAQAVVLAPFFLISRRKKNPVETDAEKEKKSLHEYSALVILADFVITSFVIITIGNYIASA